MAPKHTISEAYQLFFQNLFNFNGRTRRSDYWRVVIINSLVAGFVAGIFAGIFGEESATASTISGLINIAVWVLELGIVVRRLHDTGKEWTYLLFSLIPLVGWIIVFVALVKDSDPGDNQFGPNPKGVANVAYQAPQQPYGAPTQTYMPPQPAEPAQPYAAPAQPAEPPVAQPFVAAAPVQPAEPAPAPAPAPAAEPVAAPEAGPAYCTSCGSPLPLGSNNCPNCGAPVK